MVYFFFSKEDYLALLEYPGKVHTIPPKNRNRTNIANGIFNFIIKINTQNTCNNTLVVSSDPFLINYLRPMNK